MPFIRMGWCEISFHFLPSVSIRLRVLFLFLCARVMRNLFFIIIQVWISSEASRLAFGFGRCGICVHIHMPKWHLTGGVCVCEGGLTSQGAKRGLHSHFVRRVGGQFCPN